MNRTASVIAMIVPVEERRAIARTLKAEGGHAYIVKPSSEEALRWYAPQLLGVAR